MYVVNTSLSATRHTDAILDRTNEKGTQDAILDITNHE